MSLGNTYNNNQGNRSNPNDNFSVYSNYRMNNGDSKIDATCITFRFWKSNLCISIFPRKNTGNDEVQFDMDNGITIYLSHTKARIFKQEVENFLKDPIKYTGSGVNSGQAVITISNGAEYGKDAPVIIIRKIAEGGEVVASFAYEFHRNYHFAIRNYDGKTFDSVYDEYNNIEIEQLVTLLDEYCKAMTNAVAFSVMDQRKYSANRVENKINAIAASLNVDISSGNGSNNGQRRYNSNSHFGNSSNGGSSDYSSGVSYGSATIDDLE